MSEDLDNNWPKPWSDIKQVREDNGIIQFEHHTMEYQDGIRGYKGTLYVSESVGRETEENVDKWMPFEVYIAEKS